MATCVPIYVAWPAAYAADKQAHGMHAVKTDAAKHPALLMLPGCVQSLVQQCLSQQATDFSEYIQQSCQWHDAGCESCSRSTAAFL